MASYRGSDGRSVELGRILSRGGEGFIHEVPGQPSLVAKIWREPSEAQARKLDVLLRHPPALPNDARARIEFAWPVGAIYDEHNLMQGYFMPRVPLDQYHELVRYCIPAARRGLESERRAPFSRTELLTIARNVAEAFRYLHQIGYVIGDVNHTNFLIGRDGKAFVIDLDSIQARDPGTGEIHRCVVGKDDFTPPRLIGQRFEDVDRTPNDDLFGLAVIIFQLLMDGNHPFDPVDQTGAEGQVRQANIGRAHSPYTAIDPVQARAILDLDMIADAAVRERTRANMLALMGVEATADFSTVIGPRISQWVQLDAGFQSLFRRAFGDAHGARPVSSEWIRALESAGATIPPPVAVSPPRQAAPRQPTAPRQIPRPQQPSATQQPPARQQTPPAAQQSPPTTQQTPARQQQPPARQQPPPATQQQPAPARQQQPPAAQQPAPAKQQTSPTTQQSPTQQQPAPAQQQTPPTSQQSSTRQQSTPAQQPTAAAGSAPSTTPSGQAAASRSGSTGRSATTSRTAPLQSAAHHTPSSRGRGRRVAFTVALLLGIPVLILGGFVLFDWESPFGNSGSVPPGPALPPTPPSAPPPAPTPAPVNTVAPPIVITSEPTLTPTPTETATPVPPTRTPTPQPTPVPTEVILPPIAEVVVEEGGFIQHTFAWDQALYGDGNPKIVSQDATNVWTSPVSHSDWEATITIGADDDSFVGNGSADILITNDAGTMEYVLYVTVLDAGEATPMSVSTVTPTPAPTITPRPTVTPRPTTTPRPTVSPRPTATSMPTAPPLPASQVVFGPASGSIEHDPDDELIDDYFAHGVAAADAIIEARFYSPYSDTQRDWNSGFLFRNAQFNWFHAVIITASGQWLHILRLGDDETTMRRDFSPHIDTSANGSNLIRVVASGSEGSLFVNGHHVSDLYLGGFTEAGEISAVGEYFVDSVIMGKSTRFEDFTVRTFLEDAPLPTATPTIAPTVTPTATPAVTPTPAPASLPNLVLEWFDICVEGMGCWQNIGGEGEYTGSRIVSITWRVVNRGNAPTESPTDLRLYADGKYHHGEYLIGRDTFIIPILDPGEYVEVENLTKENPDDFWPITFSLVGDNAIIAIADIEDKVEESGDCSNIGRYKDRFSAMQRDCDNVAYVSELSFLPTPTPTVTPLPPPAQ